VNIQAKPIRASGFKNQVKDAHKRVARMVGFCLTLRDEHAMWWLSAVLHARLSPGERAFLAVAALMALTDDEYREVVTFMEDAA